MENNQLVHWGVKGMKWGVRRYQNKDGSLTAAGKSRYYREADAAGYKEESYNGRRYKTTKKGKVETFDADPNKWVKDDLSRSKRLTDESSTMAGKLKKLNDDSIRHKPKATMDLSNMTDKEMREQINRALLERQYNDMFAPQTVSKGRERASQVLETAGSVLAVGSSALGIALAIKELKG
jgi:hypothetical protein